MTSPSSSMRAPDLLQIRRSMATETRRWRATAKISDDANRRNLPLYPPPPSNWYPVPSLMPTFIPSCGIMYTFAVGRSTSHSTSLCRVWCWAFWRCWPSGFRRPPTRRSASGCRSSSHIQCSCCWSPKKFRRHRSPCRWSVRRQNIVCCIMPVAQKGVMTPAWSLYTTVMHPACMHECGPVDNTLQIAASTPALEHIYSKKGSTVKYAVNWLAQLINDPSIYPSFHSFPHSPPVLRSGFLKPS